jgi:hypothetical protein
MNYTCPCTVKLHDIFKAKNALWISAYCVTVYIICNLILKYISKGMVYRCWVNEVWMVFYLRKLGTVYIFCCMSKWIVSSVTITAMAPVVTDGLRYPCKPSPCGSNAVCKQHQMAASCVCQHGYFGYPYVYVVGQSAFWTQTVHVIRHV